MNDLLERLTSRKFLVTIVGAVIVFAGDQLGLDLSETEVYGVVAIVLGYLGVQGTIDFNQYK